MRLFGAVLLQKEEQHGSWEPFDCKKEESNGSEEETHGSFEPMNGSEEEMNRCRERFDSAGEESISTAELPVGAARRSRRTDDARVAAHHARAPPRMRT
jgi:hypothetical protein